MYKMIANIKKWELRNIETNSATPQEDHFKEKMKRQFMQCTLCILK